MENTNTPTTLEEALKALDGMLTEEDKEYFAKAPDPFSAAIYLHSNFGRYLRNKWGLWQDSALAKHLRDEHGISHPDDMSHFILEKYASVRLIRVKSNV